MERRIGYFIEQHQSLFNKLNEISSQIDEASDVISKALSAKNKILICGNGGSAADSQHFAAEIVGRFEKERIALPAIALSTDTSALTAIGNDYGYEHTFSRQVDGLGSAGDVLVGISTSGNSNNIINAVKSASRKNMTTIGLLGREGGALSSLVNIPVVVPHVITARIQEAHIFIIHYWCSRFETELFGDASAS